MRKLGFAFFLVFIAISLTNCFQVNLCTEGSGQVTKRNFDIIEFKTIYVGVPSKVFIIQDSIPKVEIETDDNLLDFIFVRVVDDQLQIESEKGICPRRLNIRITNPTYKGIQIDGSADIIALSPISTNKIYIGINGSGDVLIDSIQTNRISIAINGSGDIRIGGIAEDFNAEINGSGDINAIKLLSNKVQVETNGSGDVYVNCLQELNISISGSGDVFYLGNPSTSHIEIKGSGRLKRYIFKEKNKTY